MSLSVGYLSLFRLSNPELGHLERVNQAFPRGLEYLIYQVLLFVLVPFVLLLYLFFPFLAYKRSNQPREDFTPPVPDVTLAERTITSLTGVSAFVLPS